MPITSGDITLDATHSKSEFRTSFKVGCTKVKIKILQYSYVQS